MLSVFDSAFSDYTMQTAEATLFKGLHVQSGIITELPDILSAVDADIALADQMRKRHLIILRLQMEQTP